MTFYFDVVGSAGGPGVDILHDNLILRDGSALWMALGRRPFNPSVSSVVRLSTSWVLLFSPVVGAFSGDVIAGEGAAGELAELGLQRLDHSKASAS